MNSELALGNKALKDKNYSQALRHYHAALAQHPKLATVLQGNIKLVEKKLGGFAGTQVGEAQKPSKPETIDIVVPVFNALDDVRLCLQSLARHTDGFQVRVLVVNDGSLAETTTWLREYCAGNKLFQLIEHPANKGYTSTVNTGLRASTADYVITQNSDTIVSAGWLSGMVRCMTSDPKIGVVGPLSNAASWQNVPKLRDESGGFAVNELPEGHTVETMAQLVASVSTRQYPRLPFVNGFCFMIHRAVIEAIGYMDEENFPIGYGEENDFCIRAIDAGFELAIADDVYVYHAKSKSFGHARRKELSDQGTRNLIIKHGREKFKALANSIESKKEIDELRAAISAKSFDVKCCSHGGKHSLSILYLLPGSGGGGGSHSVVQEVMEMRRLGIMSCIAIEMKHRDKFLSNYKDVNNLKNAIIAHDGSEIIAIASQFNVIVATYFTTVELLKNIVQSHPHIMPAYYVQDYEPFFCPDGSKIKKEAEASYSLIENCILFAKTDWIAGEVFGRHGVKVHRVLASLDHDIYKPAPLSNKKNYVVTAMIRPQTPRRGAARTLLTLCGIKQKLGDSVEIHTFGCADDQLAQLPMSREFSYKNHGELIRTEVASILAKSDIFIDLSDYQAFGRTGIESMACGAVPVLPSEGGVYEYAEHNKNALIVDVHNTSQTISEVSSLLMDDSRLHDLKLQALASASLFSINSAAISEIVLLSKMLQNHLSQLDSLGVPRPNIDGLLKLNSSCVVDDALLTIVIPTYNREGDLMGCLRKLLKLKTLEAKCRIVILDDSTDCKTFFAVTELLKAPFNCDLTYYKNKSNIGYARNFANAFKIATTKYVMMLADDNEIFEDGLMAALKTIEEKKPKFISSPWFEKGKVGHRSWKGVVEGYLSKSDFFYCCDHAPGLIYHRVSALPFVVDIENSALLGNSFTLVFPQVHLIMRMMLKLDDFYYLNTPIGGEVELRESGLVDGSGNPWRTYKSMLVQASDLDALIDEITEPDIQMEFRVAAQTYHMRYLLKLIETDARRGL